MQIARDLGAARMIEPVPGFDLLSDVSDPVLITASDGTICFANAAAEVLAGWSQPMVGHPIGTLICGWRFDVQLGQRSKRIKASVERLHAPPLPVELSVSSWQVHGANFTGAVIRSIAELDGSGLKLKHQQDQADAAMAEALTSHKRLKQVVEMLPQAVCVFDAHDRYVLWNRRYAELYPEIAGDLRVGMPFADILRLSLASKKFPEKVDDGERWLSERLAKHAEPAWRAEQELSDGRWILHDDRRLTDGGAIGMRIDITDLKRREASFRLLFQSNPVPMLLFEAGTLRIMDVNDAATSFYGFAREAFLLLALPDLHQEAERERAMGTFSVLADAYDGRAIWQHRTARAETANVLVFVRASKHEERPCFLAAIVDVSDRIRAEAQISHIAHHDPVTGLANRIRFRQAAEAALDAEPDRAGRKLAVHCLDLDGFKLVNDTYGHSAGDSLLQMVGERLRASVRDGDVVARIGGDEFVIVQTSGFDDTKAMAKRLIASFDKAFWLRGAEVRVGACLGFAIAPQDGGNLDRLMLAADAALYAAKAAGRSNWRAANARGARLRALQDDNP